MKKTDETQETLDFLDAWLKEQEEEELKHYNIKIQMGTKNIDWFHDLISEMRMELEEDEYIILEECKEAKE
tara:strand:- start:5064 stop:5276 length:213 start_codon:yes stop_codon:yes gene_type:complete